MIEYIQEIFSKPQLQRSFVDNFWLTIVIIALIFIGVVIFCFAWWLFIELPYNISKWREKKKLEKNKEG